MSIKKVGKKISGAGKAAIKASGDLVQLTKLNSAIKSEENKVESLMVEIGNVVYDKYKERNEAEPDVFVSCEAIKKCMDKIEDLKLKIIEVKDMKKCPGCGEEVDKDNTFCPKCGTKLAD